MRIEALTLERYGTFSDRELVFRPDARIHLVHGPNEAGKTTLLAAIADFLFGFGHVTAFDFEHEAKSLRVGATLRLADGSTLTLRRRKGRDNTLVDPEDRPIGDDALARVLGGVARQTFLTEFGLTAHSLREGGRELVRAGGRLAETLAASSAGLSRLSRLRADLDAAADALFGPRRNAGKEFYRVADRHDAAERRLRESIVTVEAWKSAKREIEATAQAHAQLQADYRALAAELERHERTRRTRPKLIVLRRLRTEIEAFADLPEVPPATVTAWRAALEERDALTRQMAEFEEADARDRRRITELAVDEALLASGGEIDALRERLGAVAKAREDLPRRLEAQRAAQEQLADAARRLGLASYETLLAHLPTDAVLARARHLIGEGRRLGERLAEAGTRQAEAEAARQRLEAGDGAVAGPVDPAPLKRQLEAFADVVVDSDRLRRDEASLARARARLAEEARALDPPVASLDELAGQPLPIAEAIDRAVRAAEARSEAQRQLGAELATRTEQKTAAERDIAKLEAAGAISTRADLETARLRRDAALAELERVLDVSADSAERRQHLAALSAVVGEIDLVTDRLLGDSERAARRLALGERRTEAEAAIAEIERRRERLAEEARVAAGQWRDAWGGSSVAPRDPARMAIWRAALARLLDMRRELDDRQVALSALAAKLAALRPALARLAADLGLVAAPDQPLEIMYRQMQAAVEDLQSAWTAARERAAILKAAEEQARAAGRQLAKAEAELAAWRAAWPASAAAIGLATEAGLVEAQAAVDLWNAVPVHRTAFERESRSVDGIERDLADFANTVTEIAQRHGAVADRPPAETLALLVQQLTFARRAHEERQVLQEAMRLREARRGEPARRLAQISAVLEQARDRLSLTQMPDTAGAVARLTARDGLRERIAGLAGDLAGEDRDEAALWSEQDGIDLILLDATIENLKRRLAAVATQEIGIARTRLEQAENTLASLGQGRDAEGAAQAKAEASADLVDVAHRWLVRAAAARLAGLAIERHRDTVQDPLIARASALFALITQNVFSGLATDYDDKDQPVLVARRSDGRKVPIDGLSEGTADQLFLVLRLALIERRRLEPLPFIGDDLLASYDERRTAETLEALAAFGEGRQVILFTHHAHVADLAQARIGEGADILRL